MEDDDLKQLMSFDPFAGDGDAGDANDPPDGGGEAPEPGDAAGATPESEESGEGGEGATPPPDPLAAHFQQLNQNLQHLAQGRHQEPPQQDAAEDLSRLYSFNIPDQLMKLLESEDAGERRVGYAALAQGTAQAVHVQFQQRLAQAVQIMPELIQHYQNQHQQKQAVFNDFYGTHQDLNDPRLYSMVTQTAVQVAREKGISSWTPALRDETAKRVRTVLGRTQPNGEAKPGKTAVRGSARAASRPKAPTEADDVMETLFGR